MLEASSTLEALRVWFPAPCNSLAECAKLTGCPAYSSQDPYP